MTMDGRAAESPLVSMEAEQSVLGSLLLQPAAWDRVVDVLGEGDFYGNDHRLIFAQLVRMFDQNLTVDAVTVAEALESRRQLDEVGGLAYLAGLAQNTPSAANVRRYAELVREYSLLRRLSATSLGIHESVRFREGRTAAQLLDGAQGQIMALSEAARRGMAEFVSLPGLLVSTLDRLDELAQRRSADGVVGLSTGFADLDRLTTGLDETDFVVVAARPSMGKTALAMNMAEHVARQGKRVAVFSMEMNAQQLVMRVLAGVARVNAQRLRVGRLFDEDWMRLTHALGQAQALPLYINESSNLTANELRAAARRLHRETGGLGLIVVDYLQLMSSSSRGENRALELSEISRAMKGLAKELRVPVIALSQLNRSVEQRPNKRPILSDLRESGALEQDADIVMLIYRDEYYNPDSDYKGTAEVIVAKQRNGPTDTVRLAFDRELTRFSDLDYGSFTQPPAQDRAGRGKGSRSAE